MKNRKTPRCFLLLIAVLLFSLAGCGAEPALEAEPDAATAGPDQDPALIIGDAEFSYSDGLDENGFWENVRALDYVELFDYKKLPIPFEVHQVSEDDLQTEIDNLMNSYSTTKQVADRTVRDNDTVNIDYVGSVDGVEFEGGSTEGQGTEVTIGETVYIDDFLEQLIGHLPGDKFDIEVTFPDDYHEESLQGKDAVFATTINYIVEQEIPELTDEFVETTLSADLGWSTVAEMKEEIRAELRKVAIENYIRDYFTSEVVVKPAPDQIMAYQEKALVKEYQNIAAYYGVEFEEFLIAGMNLPDVAALLEVGKEDNLKNAAYSLVAQAIAEDMGLLASEEDMVNYFLAQTGSGDYSAIEQQYGLPFLKQAVLYQMVIDYIVENADFVTS